MDWFLSKGSREKMLISCHCSVFGNKHLQKETQPKIKAPATKKTSQFLGIYTEAKQNRSTNTSLCILVFVKPRQRGEKSLPSPGRC